VHWEYAFEHTFKNNKSEQNLIVVPISHIFEKDYKGLKHLWIYKNRNGENTMRVVEYQFDDLKKNKDNSLKKFTGVMMVKDFENNSIGGFVFKNNKIVGAISEPSKNNNLKNGKVKGSSCGEVTNCSWVTVGGGYDDSNYNTYWSCYTDYQCFWIETFDAAYEGSDSGNPWLPNYNEGGGGSSGNNFGEFETTNGGPYSYSYKYSECDGFSSMWNRAFAESREMLGFITSNGHVIITPSAGYSMWEAAVENYYTNQNGNTILSFYAENGAWKVQLFSPNGSLGIYTITGIVHTHPFPGPGYETKVSPADFSVANTYPTLNHYVIHSQRKIQFGPGNNIIQVSGRSCW
jgi:hypothetical protein